MKKTIIDKCIKEFSKQSKLGNTILNRYTEIIIFIGIILLFLNVIISEKGFSRINFILCAGILVALIVYCLTIVIKQIKKKNRYNEVKILREIFTKYNVDVLLQEKNIIGILSPEQEKDRNIRELIQFILPTILSLLLVLANNQDYKNSIKVSDIITAIIIVYTFIFSIMYIYKEIIYIWKGNNFFCRYILELLPYLCFEVTQFPLALHNTEKDNIDIEELKDRKRLKVIVRTISIILFISLLIGALSIWIVWRKDSITKINITLMIVLTLLGIIDINLEINKEFKHVI